MKIRFGVKQIVLAAVAAVLVGVLIAGNIILNNYAPILHGFFGGYAASMEGTSATSEESVFADQVIQDVAEDSMVLLKNEKDEEGKPYLPYSVSDKVNLFGWGATDYGFLLVGGGSGGTNITKEKPNRVTLTEAFKAQGLEYNEELTRAYVDFSDFDADYRSGGSTGADVELSLKNPPESFYTQQLMTNALAYSDKAIVVLSRWGAENGGGEELKNIGKYGGGTFLELTEEEKVIFRKLAEYGFTVTVLLNTTNPLELKFLEEYDNIKACLYVGIPGQSGCMAIPNLLFGSKITEDGEVEISPSGRLNDTYAYSWQENSPNYNNVGVTTNIAYKEGIYVGYKWYETAEAEGFFAGKGTSYENVVQFPFGYGLSYTTFKQTIKEVTHEGDKVYDSAELLGEGEYKVTVEVENTGEHAGKEVVQLYYTAPYTSGGIEKASINLLAFGKTGLLDPGQKEEVELIFTAYGMASYDDYDKNKNNFKGYELDKGLYEVKLMQNAHTPVAGTGNEVKISFNSTNGITFETDPVTGNKVENLFTGDNAYAGVPIDGSNGVNGGVTYLSRENGFANYSSAITPVGTVTQLATDQRGSVGNKSGYTYTGYETKAIKDEVATYQYGANKTLTIVSLDDEDESAPTLAQLNGTEQAVLKTQTWLLEVLFGEDRTAAEEFWDLLLNQLTQTDIKNLIGMSGFKTVALESIGKPLNTDKDGPAGFNNNVVDANTMTPFPTFPAETLSGCSWNTELMYEIGHAQGLIGTSMGVQGWYAPGVNLHRSPYNSRNYEYYSEDGRLSGYMAAKTIEGAKDYGVYCYLKHFVLAESGQNSNEWYEWITEQALRENYCKPFEIAVKVGGANAMMSAFNCVGAIWSGYNHALLTTMLREEWGFQGSVITDWGQDYMGNYGRAIKAGNNMWLRNESSAADIKFDGAGEEYAARQSARGILYTYLDTLYTSGLESQAPTAAPFSPLFVSLWTIVDVVLVLGIAACVLFFFWSPRKKLPEGTAASRLKEEIPEELPENSPEEKKEDAPADAPKDDSEK